MVLDGQEGPEFDVIWEGTLVVRADGAVMYYAVKRDGKDKIVFLAYPARSLVSRFPSAANGHCHRQENDASAPWR